jgi:hypothetical protein
VITYNASRHHYTQSNGSSVRRSKLFCSLEWKPLGQTICSIAFRGGGIMLAIFKNLSIALRSHKLIA